MNAAIVGHTGYALARPASVLPPARKDFQKIFTIFFLVAVLGAVGALLYNVFGLTISRLPYYFLLLPFILQQMLIIFRLNIRMLFCSTEVILYKDLSAEIIKPLVEEEKIGV